MAERQTREGEVVELPPEQYRHYLRCIQRLEPSTCRVISEAAAAQLAAVGAKRNLEAVKTELFEGAVDVDIGTMLAWMKKINSKTMRRAVKQLQTIDATALSRVA